MGAHSRIRRSLTPLARLSRRCSNCRNRALGCGDAARRGKHCHVAVARTRPGHSLLLRIRPPADRRQRALARARPEPEHRAPLRRDAREARLPPAGSRLEALPARPESARPRLLGDQLDGRPRDLGPAPAPAERRDGVHRQPRDPRRHRRRLYRALPVGPAGPAGDRPQPPRRRAPPCLLHGDGEGDPRLLPRRPARRDHRAHRLRAARAEHAHGSQPRSATSCSGSASSASP